MSSKDAKADQPKKPRHRHAPHQLAALNELYEKTEHPTLEQRTALAEKLGMETKTVNSWFQNKRASSKKRNKAPLTQCELPPISALIASVSAPPAPVSYAHEQEYDELSDDEPYHPLSHHNLHQHQYQHRSEGVHPSHQHSMYYGSDTQHAQVYEGDVPRKGRSRPSAQQTEELKKLYERKPHPSKEEREALGLKIGMRYQSVTNWFQNQRSIAKKREENAAAKAASHSGTRAFTPFALPPSSGAAHPSLSVPPPTSHPSLSALLHPPRARRSPSAAPTLSSRPSSPRASPYPLLPAERAVDATHRRPRRTRPEPWQLEALKKLFSRTKTPSIEDRQRLAVEIGMDVGKVTNWFRNLRQSDRKRARMHGSGSASADEAAHDHDDGEGDSMMDVEEDDRTQASGSRMATPSAASTSGVEYVKIETFEEKHRPLPLPPSRPLSSRASHLPPRPLYTRAPLAHSQSEFASDEDMPEAVTPSPESSPPPSAVASTSSLQLPLAHPHAHETKASIVRYPLDFARYESEKMAVSPSGAMMGPGVKMEDALLLLSFHHGTTPVR